MAKFYTGDKPCPGCGRAGAEVPRLSKDGLCMECTEHLNIGRMFCKERNLERGHFLLDDLTTGYVTWYQIRNKEIDGCLRELLRTFSQFDSRYAGGYCRQESMLAGHAGSGTSCDVFVLPKVTFEAARELCHAIGKAVDDINMERDSYRKELDAQLAEEKNEIYNEGVEHGRNLLFQLNAGEVTVDDFNKRIERY
ncbi:MAG: hypothetical protein J6Y37_14410 [Paludibacteraceae bacterium]|nr:hypothetical protein [Paludibacteraceae bacterium]